MDLKPFYRSRKLAYALGTLVAALIIVVLPTLGLNLEPETVDLLSDMLPLVFVLGFLTITGHTVTDIAAQWKEGVAAKSIEEALQLLLDALFEPEDEEPIPQDEIDAKLETTLDKIPK